MSKMEIGSYKDLPHYSVVGDKTSMYLWINEDGDWDGIGESSRWIKGRLAFQLWAALEQAFKKDKPSFIRLVKYHHSENRKFKYGI
tara:strand:- start:946 stop:1203 length:258 start_codon:yes stop_codon:yes gene_type:complete